MKRLLLLMALFLTCMLPAQAEEFTLPYVDDQGEIHNLAELKNSEVIKESENVHIVKNRPFRNCVEVTDINNGMAAVTYEAYKTKIKKVKYYHYRENRGGQTFDYKMSEADRKEWAKAVKAEGQNIKELPDSRTWEQRHPRLNGIVKTAERVGPVLGVALALTALLAM